MADAQWISRVVQALTRNGYEVRFEGHPHGVLLRLVDPQRSAETSYGFAMGEELGLFTRVIQNHCTPQQRDQLLPRWTEEQASDAPPAPTWRRVPAQV